MATIGQVGERAAEQLRERVDELVSAIEDGSADFADVARLADTVGEAADTVGDIYREVEQLLFRPQQDDRQTERREQRPDDGDAAVEETKEELLERARELDIEGRSSMSKQELAEAVETEEAVTKEQLLERAREAGIEGRSSMTKDELREALHAASG
jgi:hypothetical protein